MASGLFTLKQVNQAISQGAWSGYIAPRWVEYLVVAGGGSGGHESYQSGAGGGGGAGGLLTGIVTVATGASYTVTVGAGGAPIVGLNPGGGSKGNNGFNSVFGFVTAIGGGGGGGGSSGADIGVGSGGSGGGGEYVQSPGNGTTGQGNSGGVSGVAAGGGGGGAGTSGLPAISQQVAGNGGAGIASSISGTIRTYAGGGGGCSYGTIGVGGIGGGGNGSLYTVGGVAATNGTANTGGGGGGASNGANSTYIGTTSGTGGSGTVIVRYPGNVIFFTGGAITYANGYVVHTFYASGTLAPTTPAVITTDYQIQRSLRFNSADSSYLSRTLTTPTNNTTWSFSFWLKRSKLTTQQYFLNVNSYCGIGTSNDIIYFWNNAGANVASSTAVFRDVSAWYHFVFVSNGTTIKGYVNNSEVMSYTGTITNLNSAIVHNIGRDQTSTDLYLDGYMTEVNFIDGQALTPSSFGAINTNTGVWGPKAYTGTYGTNGFYLNFSDNSNTTAATLGKDYSGNNNNWTPTNFSVTAGVGNDSFVDTPTPYGTDYGLGGEVRGNYCTLNPLGTAGALVTNGNLSVSNSSTTGNRISTFLLTRGKWYWEGKGEGYVGVIVGKGGEQFTPSLSSPNSKALGYWFYGPVYWENGNSPSAEAYTSSDIIGVALDMDIGNVKFYKNNTLVHNLTFGSGGVPSFSDGVYPGYNIGGGTYSVDFNFGQRPFAYTAPGGYKAVCSTNLPAPTIGSSSDTLATKFFNTVLWTGTGTQTRSITGLDFQPDFTWMKIRADTPQDHQLYDSVRGAGGGKSLSTNTTAAEGTVNGYTDSDYGYLSSFDSGGFSVNDGAVATTGGYVNYSGRTYAAWNWKANGTAVTNTAGTITSQVSANPTSGFSIVTYTGNSVAGATRGHGLNAVPKMIFIKGRAGTYAVDNWHVYHASLPNTQGMSTNTSGAAIESPYFWNNTSPTATVFTTNNGSSNNFSGQTYVAYCFAEVPGYSAFGSYTGNGSTDGPFVHLGFRPAFILFKRSSETGNSWRVTDSTRSTYNLNSTAFLYPSESNSENEFVNDGLDILSNGFKLRVGNDPNNALGSTYIYMAFASNPFKYSLAR